MPKEPSAEIAKWPTDAAGQRKLIRRAAAMIRAGDVVAFPTDTVYGIGARASNPQAVQKLYSIKGRPASKAIALLLSGPVQLAAVTDFHGHTLEALARRFWPGGLTIVVPFKREPSEKGGEPLPTVGLRVPDHPVALALIAEVGEPLATTSANLSGAPSPTNAEEVERQIGDRLALIIDGGTCPGGRESTVVDLTTDPPAIRRLGAIGIQELESVLGPVEAAP